MASQSSKYESFIQLWRCTKIRATRKEFVVPTTKFSQLGKIANFIFSANRAPLPIDLLARPHSVFIEWRRHLSWASLFEVFIGRTDLEFLAKFGQTIALVGVAFCSTPDASNSYLDSLNLFRSIESEFELKPNYIHADRFQLHIKLVLRTRKLIPNQSAYLYLLQLDKMRRLSILLSCLNSRGR